MVLIGLFLFFLIVNSLLSHSLVMWPIAWGHTIEHWLINGLAVLGLMFALWIMDE